MGVKPTDDELDDELDDSFPASDPPSITQPTKPEPPAQKKDEAD